MTWLVWRQHRKQLLFGVIGLVAMALFLVPSGLAMRGTFEDSGLAACFPGAAHPEFSEFDNRCSGLADAFADKYQNLALVGVLFLFAPLLGGLFWGAPLVAREIENGTHRLVWTQGVSRLRWAAVKFGLIGGGALVLTGIYGALISWWIDPLNAASGSRFQWLLFDSQGIVLAGYVMFAVALGIYGGTLLRRTQAAMAFTLVGFLAVRIAMAIAARPRFMALETRRYPVVGNLESNLLHGDWVVSRAVFSASGRQLTPGIGSQALCPTQEARACIERFGAGAYNQDTLHPASDFWLFQSIELAVFVALSALVIVLAIRRIRRHIA